MKYSIAEKKSLANASINVNSSYVFINPPEIPNRGLKQTFFKKILNLYIIFSKIFNFHANIAKKLSKKSSTQRS